MPSVWMFCAVLSFSLMGVCVTLASRTHSTMEVVFYRAALGVILILVHLCARSFFNRIREKNSLPITPFLKQQLSTRYLRVHIYRSISGVLAFTLWFYSMSALPLAVSMTFNYTAPLWLAMFAWFNWFGIKRANTSVAVTLMIVSGFVGVVILLQPTLFAYPLLPASSALISGFLSAIAYSQVRALGKLNEPELRTVFYFSFISMCFALLMLPWFGSFHRFTFESLWMVLGVGVFATLGQVSLTKAYASGKTLSVANMQYFGVLWSSLFGFFLFDQSLGTTAIIGISLIVFSSIANNAISMYNKKS